MDGRPGHDAEHGQTLDLHRGDAYGDSFSDVYDRWYDGVTDAAATARFVAARCSGPRPILELGVGSGRLAVGLAETGMPVIGLDASAAMLAACPRAGGSISPVLADMRALPFRSTVAGVLVAFNTLFNLSTEDEQAGLLAEVAAILDDGPLIVEAMQLRGLPGGPQRSIGVRERTDRRVVVTAAAVDAAAQTIVGQHLEIDDGGVRCRPWRLRWLDIAQLDELASRAGLVLAERYGSWDGAAFDDESGTHISVYRRRGG